MTDPFQRMTERLFQRLGTPATLRGGQPDVAQVLVVIDKDVAVSGEYGELMARRDMASVPASAVPRIGDSLTVGSADYVLDSLEANDGYTARFFLRAA